MSLSPRELFELVSIAVFGLIFGSFLNVVIHRVPRQESLVRPRSRCPSCAAAIAWHQNLPVISWLWLRGRCASCGSWISLRYPLVELATAAVLVLVYLRFGLTLPFLLFAPYALAMVALFGIDLEHQLLPDVITLPGTALGLLVSPWNPHISWQESLVGAGLGYGLLWLLRYGYERLRGIEGLGGGDVKLAAMIGAFTGPRGLISVFLLASLAGVLVGLGLVLVRRAGMQTPLPFGCFLAPAAVLVALVGGDLIWDGWRGFLETYLYGPATPPA